MNFFGPLFRQRILTPARRVIQRAQSTTAIMESVKLQNSLKPGPPMPFVPIEAGKISWYACGPTVYDKSHLGHARNYMSTDIIRRILSNYFGFKINFVMNITDVDDKVWKHASGYSQWRL